MQERYSSGRQRCKLARSHVLISDRSELMICLLSYREYGMFVAFTFIIASGIATLEVVSRSSQGGGSESPR